MNTSVAPIKISLSDLYEQRSMNAPKDIGEIIKATVAAVESGFATLSADDGFSFSAKTSELKGSVAVGDELFFEVVKSGANSVTLKQIAVNIQKQLNKQLDASEMKEILKQQGYYKDEISDTSQDEERRKAEEAIARIKKGLTDTSGNAAKNAINELLAAGLTLENISFDMLNTAMREAEGKARIPVKNDAPKNDIIKNDVSADDLHAFMKANELEPVYTKNLQSIADKWEDVKEFNDEALLTLLRTGKKLTLENIYKAKFSIFNPNKSDISVNMNLDSEIAKYLSREGYNITPELMDISRLLVASDIALSPENLNKAQFLRNIEEYGLEKVLLLAHENIKNGKRAADIEIFAESQQENFDRLVNEYSEVIEKIPSIDAENIEFLRLRGRDLTLRNLSLLNFAARAKNVSEESLSAKRRLAEIQVKLTADAALRLAGKNININILPLQDALDTLRNMERLEYEKAFHIMGAPATDANIDKMTDLYDKVKVIRPLSNHIFGNIIQNKTLFTINELAQETYKTQETEVNIHYGDSFAKVISQFAGLLENLGIDPIDENIKAAQILSKSDLTVSGENILRIRNIDTKLDALYDRLHPFIAADMIRKNMNPVNMHIDDVLAYIDTFEGAYGSGVKDKIAQYVMDMDNANIVSDITRQAVVAVYRMLSMIQKDDSAALGVSLKKDSAITLSSLFSDAKYYQRTKGKKTDMDITVDDITDIHVRRASDTDAEKRIEAAYNENTNLLLNNIINRVSPLKLAALIEQNPYILETPLYELNNILKRIHIETTATENHTQILNELAAISPKVFTFLTQMALPLTISNILTASNILKKPHYISEILNAESDELDFNLYDELGDEFDNVDLSHRILKLTEATTRISQNLSSGDTIRRIGIIQRALGMQNHINRRHNAYEQIPVKIGDRFSTLNMYILNDDASNIYMSLDTNSLGNVSIYIKISDIGVSLTVSAEDAVALSSLKENEAELIELVNNAGFETDTIEYIIRDERNMLA